MTTRRLTTYSNGALVFDVTDRGPIDGPVVILLHGFPADRASWDSVGARLEARGIRSLAPDQRGYSPLARPPRRRDYRVADLVDDVVALIDALDAARTDDSRDPAALRVHVVGHDWGGVVAWALATAVPERLSGLTVLSTPHPAAMLAALRSSDQALRSLYIAFFQLPAVPELVLRRLLAPLLRTTGLPWRAARRYGRAMDAPGRLRAALDWYRALPLPDARARPHGGVLVPTTFVWGRRDRFLGARAASLTADHVRAAYRFVVLDENHWLPERAPARVADEILAQLGHP
jgi:pimeloyl-ACP methyl ester carboxylesterase